jgi:hypothetical protein
MQFLPLSIPKIAIFSFLGLSQHEPEIAAQAIMQKYHFVDTFFEIFKLEKLKS